MNDCMPALRCVCVFVLFVVTGNYYFFFFSFSVCAIKCNWYQTKNNNLSVTGNFW